MTRNMKSRLAIKFPTPYEWRSNALPPGQEKVSNARGRPERMLKFPFDLDVSKTKKRTPEILRPLPNLQNLNLRLVFTSDGVVVGVVIRRVERYDLVKIKLTESEAEH